MNIYLKAQRPDQALPHLRLLAQGAKNVNAVFMLGVVSENLGFLEEARSHLERALRLDPKNYSSVEALITVSDKIAPGSTAPILAEYAIHHPENSAFLKHQENSSRILQEHLHQQLYRNREPLLFIGIGHSAGSYITSELARCLGMHMWQEPIAIGQAYHSILHGPYLDSFLTCGGVNHTHMLSSPMNQSMLEISGIDKILIHIRDPRQIALSSPQAPWPDAGSTAALMRSRARRLAPATRH